MKFKLCAFVFLLLFNISNAIGANDETVYNCPENTEVVSFYGNLIRVARGSVRYYNKGTLLCLPDSVKKQLVYKGNKIPNSPKIFFDSKQSPSSFDKAELFTVHSEEQLNNVFHRTHFPMLQKHLTTASKAPKLIQIYRDDDFVCSAFNYAKKRKITCHIKSLSTDTKPVVFQCGRLHCSGQLPFSDNAYSSVSWSINEKTTNTLVAQDKINHLIDKVIKIQQFLLDKHIKQPN